LFPGPPDLEIRKKAWPQKVKLGHHLLYAVDVFNPASPQRTK